MGSPRRRKLLRRFLIVCLILLAGAGGLVYYALFYPVTNSKKQVDRIFIPTGATLDQVADSLHKYRFIENRALFTLLAEQKKYDKYIKPGCYVIPPGLSNIELINLLRLGKQTAINLVVPVSRTKAELAKRLAKQLEVSEDSLLAALNNVPLVNELGFSPENITAAFIPNTYQVYWNTSAHKLLRKMAYEHKAFWNAERTAAADSLNLSPVEVSILASIVEMETNYQPERPTIAGVYLNRLRIGMLLQADPTVKFALGDFSIKRVLFVHTAFNSPYNTYKYKGLPPGPIANPSLSAINAVLKPQKHRYIYFCAKEDFSGAHNFAVNEKEHQANANRYHQALNNRNSAK